MILLTTRTPASRCLQVPTTPTLAIIIQLHLLGFYCFSPMILAMFSLEQVSKCTIKDCTSTVSVLHLSRLQMKSVQQIVCQPLRYIFQDIDQQSSTSNHLLNLSTLFSNATDLPLVQGGSRRLSFVQQMYTPETAICVLVESNKLPLWRHYLADLCRTPVSL
ncbi:hypothetical protein ABKN59_011213, partial [Abortiporus biennis]